MKCFLIEQTGNTKFEHCGSPDCPPTCGYDLIEWRRVDTGETKWGYVGSFGWGAVAVRKHEPGLCSFWDNCDGIHYDIVLPNNHIFDPNSRASNCTMPNDRKHRCWVLHGTAPVLTADKKGVTCAAGAGSIASPGWHGYLTNGELVI
jgi:hypothetical protein